MRDLHACDVGTERHGQCGRFMLRSGLLQSAPRTRKWLPWEGAVGGGGVGVRATCCDCCWGGPRATLLLLLRCCMKPVSNSITTMRPSARVDNRGGFLVPVAAAHVCCGAGTSPSACGMNWGALQHRVVRTRLWWATLQNEDAGSCRRSLCTAGVWVREERVGEAGRGR